MHGGSSEESQSEDLTSLEFKQSWSILKARDRAIERGSKSEDAYNQSAQWERFSDTVLSKYTLWK